ncbi:MAG: glycosyltransferase family 39 protein [Saprospiraceae bacterium]
MLPKIKLSVWDYIAILICSVPAFYLLGSPAIYIWDEAVYANASLDMSQGHHWWVPEQAAYNTKPPLVLWLQAISLKCFPWPEFAVRLPSALSVTGILIMLSMALKRWGFTQWTRIFVLVCFVGNEGFIRHHIGRTGDLDAVMSFFVFGYSLIVLDAIHFNRWRKRHLILFFLMVIFSFYAKSIAGWMMLGPIGIIWILSPMRNVLWSKQFFLGGILSAVICMFYYVSRESIQPEFMRLAWHSEYLRMFSNVMPWHEHGFGYYFKNFVSLHTYTPWIFFLLAGIGYSLFILKSKSVNGHLLRWIIISLSYMLLISIPADKLEWYDAPVYPFFALILGTVSGHLADRIPNWWKITMLIPILFIFWRKINFILSDTRPRHPFEYEGAILRQIEDVDSVKVFMPVQTPEHRLQLDFYRKFIFQKTGNEIKVFDRTNDLLTGDHIIVRNENVKKVNDNFNVDTLKSWDGLGYELKILTLSSSDTLKIQSQ